MGRTRMHARGVVTVKTAVRFNRSFGGGHRRIDLTKISFDLCEVERAAVIFRHMDINRDYVIQSRARFAIKIPDKPNKNNPAPIGRAIIAVSYGPVAAEPASSARKSSFDSEAFVAIGAL